jgi:predicted nucleic acid-binding protein
LIALLDASAAIEVILSRPAAKELSALVSKAELVLAPDLYIAEVSNALWKHAKASGDSEGYTELLDDAVALPDDLIDSVSLYREAFALSLKYQQPVYDALYLVVARRNSATILTVDRRLRSLASTLQMDVSPS